MKPHARPSIRVLIFVMAGVAAGCVDTRPNVPIGTTTVALQAKLGPPLYKEPAEKGRQLWFYDMTFAVVRKYKDIAPPTTYPDGEIDPGGLEYVTDHSFESHPAALVVSPAGIVIDAPEAHVNANR